MGISLNNFLYQRDCSLRATFFLYQIREVSMKEIGIGRFSQDCRSEQVVNLRRIVFAITKPFRVGQIKVSTVETKRELIPEIFFCPTIRVDQKTGENIHNQREKGRNKKPGPFKDVFVSQLHR